MQVLDSTYKALLEKYGEDFIVEAGFFEKERHPSLEITSDAIRLPCTPIGFMGELLTIPKPAILLATGAMAPMHQGHLQMVKHAKSALEHLGFAVPGAYISPDHDQYISNKFEEGKNYDIYKRIQVIEELIKDFPWIAVDPWNGIFTNTSLNFTTIAERLQKYIHYWTGYKDIPVFFVCGSDNARFCLSFIDKGHCIVIKRPGYEDQFEKYSKYANERIIFCNDEVVKLSSTEVRKSSRPIDKTRKLFLRIEKPEYKSIIPLLEKHGGFSSIEIHEVNRQKEIISSLPENTISLDSQIELKYNFKLSRKFDLFGVHKLGYVYKAPKDIPPGDYYIFDDDICSGRTIAEAKKILSKYQINIIGEPFKLISSMDEEVLDARDFFISDLNGGLVQQYFNSNFNCRLPYIYPFVCPRIRGSIKDPYQFSIDVWKMNYELLKFSNFKIKDLKEHLFNELVLDGILWADQLCKHYIEFLKNTRKK